MHAHVSQEQVAAFCRRWSVTELSVFGSALRDDFGPDSDVDVLVRFAGGADPSISDLLDMERELERLFGRDVDLVRRELVEANRNYIIREQILSTAQPIYVEG